MREPRSALQACKLPFKKFFFFILLARSRRSEREREREKGALCDEFGIGRAIEKRTDLAAILLGFELSRTRSSGVPRCAASSCRQTRVGRPEKSSFSLLLLLFFRNTRSPITGRDRSRRRGFGVLHDALFLFCFVFLPRRSGIDTPRVVRSRRR